MSQSCCPRCGAACPGGARFCAGCGAPFAATTVQGRTVVFSPTAPGNPGVAPIDVKTVIDNARTAVGGGRTTIIPHYGETPVVHQREETGLVMDVSGSMGEELEPGVTKIEGAIRAAVNLMLNKARIDPDDGVGVISFTEDAERVLDIHPLRSDKPRIIRAIQSLQSGGGTDLNAGLVAARDAFDWKRGGVVRRIVMLTDGQGGNPIRTADDLKKRGVVIDVIAVGPTPCAVNTDLLKKVGSVVDGQPLYRFIKDCRTLVQHYTQLANKTSTGA